jgi:hypothetical protein
MKINLNRLSNIYNISENTPYDLIIFLMKTTGKTIEREKITKKFEKIKTYLESYEDLLEVSENYSNSELSRISSFVSDTEQPWEKEKLIQSFDDLLKFYNRFKFPDLKNMKFKSRNNDNPFSYDILMTCLLCEKLKIKTSKDDSIYTLSNKIVNIDNNKERSLNLIKNNVFKLNDLEIYYINSLLNLEETKCKKIDEEILENLSKNININYIIKKSILSNEEAIVYAAKFFNYDITSSDYPISVLNSITEKKEEHINFEIEDDFVRNFKINPKFFKLDKFWKKHLKFLYTPKTLSNLKNYENLDDEDLDKRYSENNFYDGVVIFDRDINTTENIVTFGKLYHKDLEVIEISSLYDIFSRDLSFTKYSTNIEKLVNICRENKDEDYKSLHKKIRLIQKYYSTKDETVMELKKERDKYKNNLKEIFTKLYEISELLKNKETIDDLENISIMNSILNLNNYISEIKDQNLKEKINNLPLLNYKNEKFFKIEDSNLTKDLSDIKNLKDKTSDFLVTKSKIYSMTSYYYNYIFYKEIFFNLEERVNN